MSTTDTPDRAPTWAELRETVLSQGADLDATRTDPRGIAGAQHERWMAGHDYAGRQVAEPPPPPRKPTPKVTVRGVDPKPAPTPARAGAAAEADTLGRLVEKLRAEGVPATLGQDGDGLRINVPDGHRDHAEKLLGGWAIG